MIGAVEEAVQKNVQGGTRARWSGEKIGFWSVREKQ
jgi:hypothetical protein